VPWGWLSEENVPRRPGCEDEGMTDKATGAADATAGPGPLRDPLELLEVSWLLSEEERDIQASVRGFLADRARPHLGRWFEDGHFPRDLVPELGKLGLLGMHLEGYGCAGTTATSYGLACLELEAADSALRSFVSVQGSLSMYSIRRYGSEEQRRLWLPRLASGAAIGCFGLTEPDFGSDPANMRTRAVRVGADWVLNGSKQWITNGSIADVATVWAATEEGIRGFLVPRGTRGFTATDIGHKQSLRASITSALSFDDVRLPASAQLPEARGLGAPLSCLNEARFGILFGAVGAARDCLQTALSYADARVQFGRPISSFQLTQRKLADMAVALNTSMLLALHLGRLKDAGRIRPEQVSTGKLNNVRQAIAIARECRTILGANGISLDYSPLRHANNLESVLTYEGTEEIHTLVVGQALTGQAAYR
jgi:glutaryl-CoA dehydrogenase